MNCITYACSDCGSTNVHRDATAAWDEHNQKWSLMAVQDQAYCDACNCETSLVECQAEDSFRRAA